jgi:amino acid transporter
MASLAFLVVYGMVSVGHLRVRRETGANVWMLAAAVALNAALFLLPLGYTISKGPATTWVTLLPILALSFVIEAVYRWCTGRRLMPATPQVASAAGAAAEASPAEPAPDVAG